MAKTGESQICIVTVTGADKVGIIAELAAIMAKADINIVDVNQRIMETYFVMTMAVDMAKATIDMARLKRQLDRSARKMELTITIQHERIFEAIHRV